VVASVIASEAKRSAAIPRMQITEFGSSDISMGFVIANVSWQIHFNGSGWCDKFKV